MDLIYAELSSKGPVRAKNEDRVGFWQPDDPEERRTRGAVVVLADGVGGQGQGDVASGLAVETALEKFQEAKPGASPRQLLWQLFTAANLAVYDRSMERRAAGRMATTLTISLLRNDELTIGHVGDCRAYLVQDGRISQLTADHSYAALQVKLGLLSPQDAANSQMRCMLTRSVGKEPVVQVDYFSAGVSRGSRLIQCSDGLYQCVTEGEIGEIVAKEPPEEACRRLVELAEKRGTDDNLSVQIVHVQRVEQVMYYRGLPIYHEPELPMSHELEVGQVLDERFHLLDVISRSGMASIFKAKDVTTGQIVAVKVPFLQFESDPGFYSRFQREEEIGKAMNHPYILHFLPVEVEKSRPYIVMEHLSGQTLRQVLRNVGRLPVADALSIAGRICEALEYLHQQQVIHRDLKPENIMLCDDGSIRIMDFGIAKAAGQRRLTFTGFTAAMGTPDYMAPEQVKGKRGNARTDIYSLGAMLYEMATGETPFEGANPYAIMNARLIGDPVAPRKHNPEITPQVEEIILHALEQKPYDRYATAAEMRAELAAPESVQLTGRCQRLRPQRPWRNRWRWLRYVLLLLLLPAAFYLVYLLAPHHR